MGKPYTDDKYEGLLRPDSFRAIIRDGLRNKWVVRTLSAIGLATAGLLFYGVNKNVQKPSNEEPVSNIDSENVHKKVYNLQNWFEGINPAASELQPEPYVEPSRNLVDVKLEYGSTSSEATRLVLKDHYLKDDVYNKFNFWEVGEQLAKQHNLDPTRMPPGNYTFDLDALVEGDDVKAEYYEVEINNETPTLTHVAAQSFMGKGNKFLIDARNNFGLSNLISIDNNIDNPRNLVNGQKVRVYHDTVEDYIEILTINNLELSKNEIIERYLNKEAAHNIAEDYAVFSTDDVHKLAGEYARDNNYQFDRFNSKRYNNEELSSLCDRANDIYSNEGSYAAVSRELGGMSSKTAKRLVNRDYSTLS